MLRSEVSPYVFPASISGLCHPGLLGLPLLASCSSSTTTRERLKSQT